MKPSDIIKLIGKLLPKKKFTKDKIINIQSVLKPDKRAIDDKLMEEYRKVINNDNKFSSLNITLKNGKINQVKSFKHETTSSQHTKE